MKIIIEAQFLPPVEAFGYFSKAKTIYLEAHENYQKRSYRNRCFLLNQGGKFVFSLPLEKGKNQKQPIKKIKIAQNQDWINMLQKHMQSAYGKRPFFDFYKDEIFELIIQHQRNLFDLNKSLLTHVFKLFNWEKEILETTEYLDQYPTDYCDLRNIFSPVKKNIDINTSTYRYPQVFEYKHGFTSKLSIVDLIFNLGPESVDFLINFGRQVSDCQ